MPLTWLVTCLYSVFCWYSAFRIWVAACYASTPVSGTAA